MVLTDNEDIAERISGARNLFFDKERRYIHSEIGSNFRMTNMQAAIGLAQLEQIEKTIIKKRKIGQIYQDGLGDIDCIQLPLKSLQYADNIYWVFGLLIKKGNLTADDVMEKLRDSGIGTRHFFYPIHKQPALQKLGYFKGVSEEEYKNSNSICERGFYIPSGVGLTEEDQEYVIEELKKILS